MSLSCLECIPDPILHIIIDFGICPVTICYLNKNLYSKVKFLLKKYDYISLFNDAVSNFLMETRNSNEPIYSDGYFEHFFYIKPPNEKQINKLHNESVNFIFECLSIKRRETKIKPLFKLFKFRSLKLTINIVSRILSEFSFELCYNIFKNYDLDLYTRAYMNWFNIYRLETYPPLLDLFIKAEKNHPLEYNSTTVNNTIIRGNSESWDVLLKNKIIKEDNFLDVMNTVTQYKNENMCIFVKHIFPIIVKYAIEEKSIQIKEKLLISMAMCGFKLFDNFNRIFTTEDLKLFRKNKSLLIEITLTSIMFYDFDAFLFLDKEDLLFYDDVISLFYHIICYNKPSELVVFILNKKCLDIENKLSKGDILGKAIESCRIDIVKILLEKTNIEINNERLVEYMETIYLLLEKKPDNPELRELRDKLDIVSKDTQKRKSISIEPIDNKKPKNK